MKMTEDKIKQARFLYLVLAGIFISLLITCNLIFLKFISWEIFDSFTIKISVGLLPYPLTFLVTDIISEIYGKKKANEVVKVGLICTLLVMGITIIADSIPAMHGSPVDDAVFSQVFGLTGVAVAASMIAYLLAQFIDIRIYHYWKVKTKGKHLWLRNNFSTFSSQFLDTTVVLLLLSTFSALPWSDFSVLFISSIVYKILVALADTPFLYLFVNLIKKHFSLKVNEEITL
jgi:queuosine precursor transporter